MRDESTPGDITDREEQSHATTATQDSGKSTFESSPPLPPPSMESLVSMLGIQAVTYLGKGPAVDGVSPTVRVDLAKHYIDLLGMLEEKTKGNLTNDESSALAYWLYQLRMMFVTESGKR